MKTTCLVCTKSRAYSSRPWDTWATDCAITACRRSICWKKCPARRNRLPATRSTKVHLQNRCASSPTPSPRQTANRYAKGSKARSRARSRSEEHTSELQSHLNLVCRLLLEKKKISKHPSIHVSPSSNWHHTPPFPFQL